MIMALFLAFCFDLSTGSIRTASFAFLLICTVMILVVFRRNFPGSAVFYTMISAVALKLAYVLYTPVWCRQHDVIDFGAGEGHAAYMEYILTHKALPDFDPRTVWAFFQPPLHHFLSAAWMWFNIRCGINTDRMHKNVQILPFIYMCILMLIVYLICRQLNMKKSSTLITMLIVSFHPIYILMSGSINNDALATVLSVIAIYVAILWYMYPTTPKIIQLALFIGLAMSAKLSSALVAVPIGILMVYKIVVDTARFKDKEKLISYVLEMIPFVLVVFPLGLWWTIRNKILFNMPLNYIPEVGEQIENTGLVPTLLDVRTASPFLYMKANGYAYDEYNLILATIKSALFGEGDFVNISPLLTAAGWMLFATAVIIIILSICAVISVCTDREASVDAGLKLFLTSVVIVYIAGYCAFAVTGRNLSAMNFRYSAAAVAVLAVFAGLWYGRCEVKGRNKTCRLIMASALLFAVSSGIFYILLGLLDVK